MTVAENVAFPLKCFEIIKQIKERVDFVLNRVALDA
jgi:ABC-type Fe3+/spermidine/putrescine transport system ATPase subunit